MTIALSISFKNLAAVFIIIGDDRIGMVGGMQIDVGDSRRRILHHRNGDNGV